MAEFDWISRYFAPLASGEGAAGLSDDVARLDTNGGALVVTVDALVEGVHFLPTDPIDTIARKLVRVNVSDLIAKGAKPREALLTLGWPEERPEGELAEFAAALGEELALWGAGLVGGDTVRNPGGLFLSMTMTGICDENGPIRRYGARIGDDLWVTGVIGAGGLGLAAAQDGVDDEALVSGYRLPSIPPLAVSDVIASYASASIDISDGLLADALHLAEASGVLIEIDLENVPLVRPQRTLDDIFRLCTAGDDYQVLFTANPENAAQILASSDQIGSKVRLIGKISAGSGLKLMHENALVNNPETLGFQHGP